MADAQTAPAPAPVAKQTPDDPVVFVNVAGRPLLTTRADAQARFKQETDQLKWGDTPKSRIVEAGTREFKLLSARATGDDYDTDHGEKLSDDELAAKLGLK